LGGGALEVVNDDSSVPMPISMKNSRSSWLRCSVASVVTDVVAARLMTGAPTALPGTEEFGTFLSLEADPYPLFTLNRPGARTPGRFA